MLYVENCFSHFCNVSSTCRLGNFKVYHFAGTLIQAGLRKEKQYAAAKFLTHWNKGWFWSYKLYNDLCSQHTVSWRHRNIQIKTRLSCFYLLLVCEIFDIWYLVYWISKEYQLQFKLLSNTTKYKYNILLEIHIYIKAF